MCHSRRVSAARAKARVMNIYPRLLQNKCWYRETCGERATKRNEESRNPGLRLRFFSKLLYMYRACACMISTGGLKFHPILPLRLSIWRLLLDSCVFPESTDIYFRRPETSVYLCRLLGLVNLTRFHTFSSLKNLAAMITVRIKFTCPRLGVRLKGFPYRESLSKWHLSSYT